MDSKSKSEANKGLECPEIDQDSKAMYTNDHPRNGNVIGIFHDSNESFRGFESEEYAYEENQHRLKFTHFYAPHKTISSHLAKGKGVTPNNREQARRPDSMGTNMESEIKTEANEVLENSKICEVSNAAELNHLSINASGEDLSDDSSSVGTLSNNVEPELLKSPILNSDVVESWFDKFSRLTSPQINQVLKDVEARDQSIDGNIVKFSDDCSSVGRLANNEEQELLKLHSSVLAADSGDTVESNFVGITSNYPDELRQIAQDEPIHKLKHYFSNAVKQGKEPESVMKLYLSRADVEELLGCLKLKESLHQSGDSREGNIAQDCLCNDAARKEDGSAYAATSNVAESTHTKSGSLDWLEELNLGIDDYLDDDWSSSRNESASNGSGKASSNGAKSTDPNSDQDFLNPRNNESASYGSAFKEMSNVTKSTHANTDPNCLNPDNNEPASDVCAVKTDDQSKADNLSEVSGDYSFVEMLSDEEQELEASSNFTQSTHANVDQHNPSNDESARDGSAFKAPSNVAKSTDANTDQDCLNPGDDESANNRLAKASAQYVTKSTHANSDQNFPFPSNDESRSRGSTKALLNIVDSTYVNTDQDNPIPSRNKSASYDKLAVNYKSASNGFAKASLNIAESPLANTSMDCLNPCGSASGGSASDEGKSTHVNAEVCPNEKFSADKSANNGYAKASVNVAESAHVNTHQDCQNTANTNSRSACKASSNIPKSAHANPSDKGSQKGPKAEKMSYPQEKMNEWFQRLNWKQMEVYNSWREEGLSHQDALTNVLDGLTPTKKPDSALKAPSGPNADEFRSTNASVSKESSVICKTILPPPESFSSCKKRFSPPSEPSSSHRTDFLPPAKSSITREARFLPPLESSNSHETKFLHPPVRKSSSVRPELRDVIPPLSENRLQPSLQPLLQQGGNQPLLGGISQPPIPKIGSALPPVWGDQPQPSLLSPPQQVGNQPLLSGISQPPIQKVGDALPTPWENRLQPPLLHTPHQGGNQPLLGRTSQPPIQHIGNSQLAGGLSFQLFKVPFSGTNRVGNQNKNSPYPSGPQHPLSTTVIDPSVSKKIKFGGGPSAPLKLDVTRPRPSWDHSSSGGRHPFNVRSRFPTLPPSCLWARPKKESAYKRADELKRRRVDELSACPRAGQQSHPDPASSRGMLLYIEPSGHPNEYLSNEQMDAIENSILETIVELTNDTTLEPTFKEVSRHNGRYKVICENELSKRWLYKYASRIHPWPNESLKIIPATWTDEEDTKLRESAVLPWKIEEWRSSSGLTAFDRSADQPTFEQKPDCSSRTDSLPWNTSGGNIKRLEKPKETLQPLLKSDAWQSKQSQLSTKSTAFKRKLDRPQTDPVPRKPISRGGYTERPENPKETAPPLCKSDAWHSRQTQLTSTSSADQPSFKHKLDRPRTGPVPWKPISREGYTERPENPEETVPPLCQSDPWQSRQSEIQSTRSADQPAFKHKLDRPRTAPFPQTPTYRGGNAERIYSPRRSLFNPRIRNHGIANSSQPISQSPYPSLKKQGCSYPSSIAKYFPSLQ